MLNRGLKSVNDAFEEGRFHVQRFFKNAITINSGAWTEFSGASGQPLYNARIGATSLAFFPTTFNGGNDYIYYPPVASGSERYLTSMTCRTSGGTAPQTVHVIDCLGYYPLIDGDSTELQTLDNTLTLPRYTDGVGVSAALFNSISPVTSVGAANYTIVNSDGNSSTLAMRTSSNTSLNSVISTVSPTLSTATGAMAMLTNGGKGARSVTSIQYTTPPSGIQYLMLFKVLGSHQFVGSDTGVSGDKSFIQHAGMGPILIPDGTCLSLLQLGSSSAGAAFFGELTFIWN